MCLPDLEGAPGFRSEALCVENYIYSSGSLELALDGSCLLLLVAMFRATTISARQNIPTVAERLLQVPASQQAAGNLGLQSSLCQSRSPKNRQECRYGVG